MENQNGKGPGIFYGIIGVATLVVAIIGATFAYFTATAENTDTIQGEAATTGLNLAVTKVSTDASAGLIPLADADTSKALAGDTESDSKMCLDKNGNTVCQVYKIEVSNSGSAAAVVNGTVSITGTTFANLKWQLLTGTTDETLAVSEMPTYNPIATTTLDTNKTLSGAAGTSASATYYIMVWISNIDSSQNTTDTGSFTGTVTFNSADGAGVSATFSA